MTSLVSLICGGGVVHLFTLKEKKKEAAINNDTNSTENMRKVIDERQEELAEKKEEIRELKAELKEKEEKYEAKLESLKSMYEARLNDKETIINGKNDEIDENGQAIKKLHMHLDACARLFCMNESCPLREPTIGTGPMKFEKMRESGVIKSNQTPIAEIAKKKGYKLEQII